MVDMPLQAGRVISFGYGTYHAAARNVVLPASESLCSLNIFIVKGALIAQLLGLSLKQIKPAVAQFNIVPDLGEKFAIAVLFNINPLVVVVINSFAMAAKITTSTARVFACCFLADW